MLRLQFVLVDRLRIVQLAAGRRGAAGRDDRQVELGEGRPGPKHGGDTRPRGTSFAS